MGINKKNNTEVYKHNGLMITPNHSINKAKSMQ